MNVNELFKEILVFILLILTFIVLSGCNAKKSTTQVTKTSDTLITKSFEYRSKPIETTYLIDLECDTLTGKIRNVNRSETSGTNSTTLEIINNKLRARLKTAESSTKVDTIYKTKFEDKFFESEIVRYKYPFWVWFVIVLQALIIILLLRFK